ncbi:MAG: hypothetical protein A7315_05820 [Candidatus Altiarchaeales archaeon WOR_SM1_79]|nr:MAG: hypothetical protein A7315_05820 [Candidatus Altiarchaeales archaeon WOR_SM1_79]
MQVSRNARNAKQKQHEIEPLLYEICEKNFPEILGNEYLIFGTLDRCDWKKIQEEPTPSDFVLEKAYIFKDVWDFEPVTYESYLARKKIKTKEKNKKLLTAGDIYKKHENVDDAIGHLRNEHFIQPVGRYGT